MDQWDASTQANVMRSLVWNMCFRILAGTERLKVVLYFQKPFKSGGFNLKPKFEANIKCGAPLHTCGRHFQKLANCHHGGIVQDFFKTGCQPDVAFQFVCGAFAFSLVTEAHATERNSKVIRQLFFCHLRAGIAWDAINNKTTRETATHACVTHLAQDATANDKIIGLVR